MRWRRHNIVWVKPFAFRNEITEIARCTRNRTCTYHSYSDFRTVSGLHDYAGQSNRLLLHWIVCYTSLLRVWWQQRRRRHWAPINIHVINSCLVEHIDHMSIELLPFHKWTQPKRNETNDTNLYSSDFSILRNFRSTDDGRKRIEHCTLHLNSVKWYAPLSISFSNVTVELGALCIGYSWFSLVSKWISSPVNRCNQSVKFDSCALRRCTITERQLLLSGQTLFKLQFSVSSIQCTHIQLTEPATERCAPSL